jgi:SAM-dependent methyltransferase
MYNLYKEKYAKYYDSLHCDKDYEKECELIYKYSKNYVNLLDIGCGTGQHSLNLHDKFERITGVDLSEDMINVAKEKVLNRKINNVEFKVINTDEIEEKFDTIISMFNVVNHIDSLSQLIDFFKNISFLLNQNGVFIFDCWNGTSCRIGIPQEYKEKEIICGENKVSLKTNTKTDLFNSTSIMETQVDIFSGDNKKDSFEYVNKHFLWTPDILKELVVLSGMKINKIIPYFNDEKNANENDYRITFICIK